MTLITKQHIKRAKDFINQIPKRQPRYRGRGVVICGGGDTYLPGAWVCIKMLRKLGCRLPIQLWYLGRKELSDRVEKMLIRLNVECVDALKIRKIHPCRILNGYELKAFALLHSSLKEILLLDADNIPLVKPELLFKMKQYKECGALFWPRNENGPPAKAWEIFDVPYRAELAFDTGQILVDKSKVWKALSLTLWYNAHSDFYYRFVDGEKETFHLSFRKLNVPYGMVNKLPQFTEGVLYHCDNKGERIFQHRKAHKWKLYGLNKRIMDFRKEAECFRFLNEFRTRLVGSRAAKTKANQILFRCAIDGFTGYGLHAQQIIRDFDAEGWRLGVTPIRIDEPPTVPILQDIKDHFVDYSDAPFELLLHPPNVSPTEGKQTIFFTMWESTRLAPLHLENLKKAKAVIVPCEWNADTFSAQGIDAPIHIVPLGINERTFYVRRPTPADQCIFGAAGNSHISGPTRKGLDEVIKAFQIAFPKEQDVFLKVKTLPGSQIRGHKDRRIHVIKEYFSQSQLAEWYSSLTCFVSAAKAEAWGLMQHQAMGVGRPVIASNYGGLREFFNPVVGYCVDYKLVASDERYAGLGVWAQPCLDSLVEQMRQVYNSREEAARKGILASKQAHLFTWTRANRRLLSIIQTFVS